MACSWILPCTKPRTHSWQLSQGLGSDLSCPALFPATPSLNKHKRTLVYHTYMKSQCADRLPFIWFKIFNGRNIYKVSVVLTEPVVDGDVLGPDSCTKELTVFILKQQDQIAWLFHWELQQWQTLFLLEKPSRDLPGGPVAKTLSSLCRSWLDPWSGNYIPHASTKGPIYHKEDWRSCVIQLKPNTGRIKK